MSLDKATEGIHGGYYHGRLPNTECQELNSIYSIDPLDVVVSES